MMIIILTILLIFFLFFPNLIQAQIIEATRVWYFVLLPTMFPSFMLSDLIINNKTFNNIINYIYKKAKYILPINYPISLVIIIISYIFGSPLSTKMINDALNNKIIDSKEANNLACVFSHLSLPYIILICNQFNLRIGLFMFFTVIIDLFIFTLLNGFKKKELKEQKVVINSNTIDVFFNSINKNSQALLGILGVIICFKIVALVLPLSFYPYIEILGGINSLSSPSTAKIASILSFMGLAIHMQIFYCYKSLNYPKFLFVRLLSSLIIFILFII